ncbi:MAG: hypothetical protein ACOYOK_00665 [Pseudobdellovibrionaceae bacterium]
MLLKPPLEAISLFYSLVFLDEKIASEASSKAWSLWKRKIKNNSNNKPEVLVVLVTHQVWFNFKKHFEHGKSNFIDSSSVLWPSEESFKIWVLFHKISVWDELFVVIWSNILGCSVESIAEGLSTSEGTIRYRNARALKRLGEVRV